MTKYEGDLLDALENILYRDRSKKSLKSTDLEVLSLLSGDEEAVIYYLKQFHLKHPDKSDVIHTGKCLEVVIPGPPEHLQGLPENSQTLL